VHENLHLGELAVGVSRHPVRDVPREAGQRLGLLPEELHLLVLPLLRRVFHMVVATQRLVAAIEDGDSGEQQVGHGAANLPAEATEGRYALLLLLEAQGHQLARGQGLHCPDIIIGVILIKELDELCESVEG